MDIVHKGFSNPMESIIFEKKKMTLENWGVIESPVHWFAQDLKLYVL